MRVFVTGASGFIGQAVIQELHAHGHQAVGLARSDSGAEKLQKLGAEVQRGSLQDLDGLRAGARAADGVIHLGFGHDFSDLERICREDREAITAMATVMEGTNKPLVIPTGVLMVPAGRLGTEADAYDPTNPMAAARGPSEDLVKSFASKGVRGAIVRLAPTVHGDGDHGFVTMLMHTSKEKGVVGYVADGANLWTAIHRLDAARLFRLALEKAPAGSTYHGVGEPGMAWKDIAEAMGSALKLPTKSLTWDEAQAHYGWMAGIVATDNPASSAETQEQLGWKPEQVKLIPDIRDGKWYASAA